MPDAGPEDDKPPVSDHSRLTGSLAYELGRAEADDPTDQAAVEAICYEHSDVDRADLRPEDWLRPVYASDGRIVLACHYNEVTRAEEGVWVRYDGTLQALVYVPVLGDWRPVAIDHDWIVEFVGDAADHVTLVPLHESPWGEEVTDVEAARDQAGTNTADVPDTNAATATGTVWATGPGGGPEGATDDE